MKKVLPIAILLSLLLSGCYLVLEPTPTAVVPATGTVAAETGTAVNTATSTTINTQTPTLTRTPVRTAMPAYTSTPVHTATPIHTATPMPYTLQVEAPVYIKNFVHTDAGCDWLGVAGQVFGEDGEPVINLVLVVSGTLNGSPLNLTAVTGIPEADVYGPGGYEIQLASQAVASSDSLNIQVYDLAGNALSAPYVFDTYAACTKNLAIINFKAQ
ncbi:MAG: hypothetical protein PWQ55_1658 [Chloroflexota bacterium]|nr:hypothetical protein [Chloroflexota bacterium]